MCQVDFRKFRATVTAISSVRQRLSSGGMSFAPSIQHKLDVGDSQRMIHRQWQSICRDPCVGRVALQCANRRDSAFTRQSVSPGMVAVHGQSQRHVPLIGALRLEFGFLEILIVVVPVHFFHKSARVLRSNLSGGWASFHPSACPMKSFLGAMC